MAHYQLIPFQAPQAPFSPPFSIEVETALSKAFLEVSFLLKEEAPGGITSLHLPEQLQNPIRQEGLYHHSCFEIFFQRGTAYFEWNFSFSGNWCQFLFSDYRKRTPSALEQDPSFFQWVSQSRSEHACAMKIALFYPRLDFLGDLPPRLGFSAILEHPEEKLSYWALKHPRPQPDFHAFESFTAKLE